MLSIYCWILSFNFFHDFFLSSLDIVKLFCNFLFHHFYDDNTIFHHFCWIVRLSWLQIKWRLNDLIRGVFFLLGTSITYCSMHTFLHCFSITISEKAKKLNKKINNWILCCVWPLNLRQFLSNAFFCFRKVWPGKHV